MLKLVIVSLVSHMFAVGMVPASDLFNTVYKQNKVITTMVIRPLDDPT